MARNAHMSITAAKQGQIKGGVTLKAKEGSIELFSLSSDIAASFDQASGAASGKRQHHPIVITKPIDQATPKLYQALVTNENLNPVTIKFWRPAPGGLAGAAEQQYFTIELTNARIVDIRLISADIQDATKTAQAPYEEVQFVYQKIAWTWVEGGIASQDTWTSPVT